MTSKTTIPDLTRGTFLSLRRGIWYAQYMTGDKIRLKSMKTEHLDLAKIAQAEFYATLGVAKKKAKTWREKVEENSKKYVYKRPPYYTILGGKHLGFYYTRKEADNARDKFIEENEKKEML